MKDTIADNRIDINFKYFRSVIYIEIDIKLSSVWTIAADWSLRRPFDSIS